MNGLRVMDKKQLKELNRALSELETLYEELCKAESVGVPGMDIPKNDCVDLKLRIEKLKAAYFSQDI